MMIKALIPLVRSLSLTKDRSNALGMPIRVRNPLLGSMLEDMKMMMKNKNTKNKNKKSFQNLSFIDYQTCSFTIKPRIKSLSYLALNSLDYHKDNPMNSMLDSSSSSLFK